MKRSGRLVCSNDQYIMQLLKDQNYIIEPTGDIWTLTTKTGKLSTCGLLRLAGYTKDGYRALKYKGKMLQVHRIIYAKFGNEPLAEDLVVNHLDDSGLNNDISNLELVTQSKNNFHRFRKDGGKPPVMGNKVLTWEIVREIRYLKKELGYSHNTLANNYGISKGHVSQIITQAIWIEGKEYA